MREFSQEDKEIAKQVLCKICKEFLTEPIQLPCSENICNSHLNDLIKKDEKNNKEYFDCDFCKQKHLIEKKPEFIFSKNLSFFCDRYKNSNCDFAEYFKECKQLLKIFGGFKPSSHYENEFVVNFSDLKSMVYMRREDVILEINKASDELLDEINKLEREYFNKLENIYSGFDLDQFKDQVKEYEVKLDEYKIDLDEWVQINEKIKQDLNRLDQISEDSTRLVVSSKNEINFKEGSSSNNDFKNLIGQITIDIPKRLISGSFDNSIKIWDVESGQCIKTMTNAHQGFVHCLELLDDDKFASGSGDKTIKIWDLKTFKCLKTLNGHSASVYCLKKVNENELISGSDDSTIKIWDLNSGDCINTLRGHFSDLVRCLEITNDKKILVSCADDLTIKIWDYENGECLRTLTGHSDYVLSLSLMNNKIISGSADKTIKIWDIDSGECLRTLNGHDAFISCIEAFKDNLFLSGSDDGYIRLWDIENGNCLWNIKAHDGYIIKLVIGISEEQIFCSANDKTIKIWNIENGECLKTLTGHSASVRSLIFNS